MEQILFIDPDKNILQETGDFLQSNGYVVIGTGEGASGVEKALKNLPDIILCNTDLPDMNGYEVFKALQQNKSTATIPFVFLMNKASIKDIRKAMKMGADDCLVKPWSFEELSEVIKTRIDKKQRIINDRSKKVHRQEQYLRTILQTTKDGFWIVNHKGKIIDVNKTYCQMTGFTRDEVLEMTIRDMDAIETDQEAMDRMARVKKNVSEIFETRLWRKDKTVFDAEISVTYLNIKKGQYICFCRDITQRKNAEKEISGMASMLDLAPSAIAILDEEGRFLYTNLSYLQWHGYTSEELRQLSIHDLNVPESRKLIEERIAKIKNEGEASFEVKHYRKDGSIIPLLLFVKKIDWNGTPAMLSIGTDITEHKNAEKNLKESEKKYRRIAENISDVVWITDLNLKTTFVSPSIEKLTGEKPDAHLKRKFEERYPPKSLKKIQSIFSEELEREKDPNADKNRSRIVELQQYHTNGTLLWVSINVSFIRDENGNPIGLQGVTRDIIKLKQAELELKQSNQKNEAILEALPDLMFVLSSDGVYLDYYANKTDDLLMPPEHFLNRKDRDVLPGYLAEANQKTLKKLFKTGKVQNYSYTLEMHRKTMYFDARMVKLDEKRALSIVRNITDQKKAEKELIHSHNLMQYIIEHNRSAIAVHDKNLHYIYVSKPYFEQFKVKEKDIIGKHHYEVFPDLPQKWRDVHQKALQGIVSSAEDDPYYKEDGSVEWTRWECRPWYESDGSVGGIIVYTEVITERKNIEIELKEKTSFLSTLLETSPVGIVTVDKTGNITYANNRAEQILGLVKEEITSRTYDAPLWKHTDLDGSPLPDEKQPFNIVKKSLNTVFDVQHGITWPDGRVVILSINAAPIKDSKGQFNGMIASIEDISEIKQAELKLKAEHNRLEFLMQATGAHFNILDSDYNIVDVDTSWQQIYGDPQGRKCHEYFMGIEKPCSGCGVPIAFETKEITVNEEFLPVENKYFEVHTIPFQNEQGEWLCAEFNIDITERKKAEEALQSNYALLQIAGETARFGGWSVDLENNITTWSDAVADIHEVPHGYVPSVDEAINFYAPEWRETITQVFNDCAQKGIPYDEEMEIITRKGKRLWVRANARAMKDENGQIIKVQGSFQDITERKQAEEALRQSEEKFKNLFEDNVASMFLIEADTGNLVDVNEAAVKFYGWSRDEMCRMNINQINTLSPEEIKKEMAKAKNSRRLHYEFKHKRADGSVRDVEVFGSRIEIEGKDYLHSIIHDITEKKKAEKELTEQKELLTAIYSNAPLIMMVVNKERRVQQINGYAKQFAGRDAEEMLGFRSGEALRCLHALDDPKGCGFGDFCQQCVIRNSILDTLETGKTHLQEEAPYFFKGEDDKIREMTFMTSTTAIMVKGMRMVLVTLQDITDIKLAEKALKESEERFRYLFRDIPTIAVQGYRFDGTTTYWNKASENLYGYTAEEAIGRNLHDLIIPSEMQENVRNEMRQMYKSMKPVPASEMSLIRKDGTRVSVFVNHAIVQRHNHEPELFCLDIDITQRKQAEKMLQERNEIIQAQNEEYESINEELKQTNEELFKAKEHAEESDRLKSAFLANMSHEIRTPMNSILGFSSLLGKDNLPETAKKHYIRIIQTSGKNLVQIVNDVIDIAMIESGQLKISQSKVLLNQLFYGLYEIFTEKIKTDNLNIQLNLKIPDKEYTLFTDELRVKQILTNFLSNAFKFTEKGEIELGFRGVKNNKVKMYVKDTGIGIPKDKLETIFERFRQADDSTTRKYGGTGLGLAISKNLVELLNSKIGVKSEINKGSEFYFTLSGDQG